MNYRTAPAFSLPASRKKTIFEMPWQDYASPGPVYDTRGVGATAGSQSIGRSRRTQVNHWVEPTPSPAHYSPPTASSRRCAGLARAQPVCTPNDNPDPACYNPEVQAVRPRSPQFSLTARYQSIMDDVGDNPGPGQYERSREMPVLGRSKSERPSLFASAARFHPARAGPGVGDYEVSTEGLLTNRGTIGSGEREPLSKPQLPGPGDYARPSALEEGVRLKLGKSISMKLRGCFEHDPLTQQAFIKYFPEGHPQPARFPTSRKPTVPKERREVFKTNRNPGPSDYNSQAYTGKSPPKAVIPASTYAPHNELQDTPAPGAYRVEAERGPAFTIPRAKSATLVRDHPGVGRYTVSQGLQARAGSAMPRSARTDFVSKNRAGVGDYELQERRAFKGTMGRAARFGKVQGRPGPGDYHIAGSMGYVRGGRS